MGKLAAVFATFLLIFFLWTGHAEARRSGPPSMSASLARNGYVNINFSGLRTVKSVSYQLTYGTNAGPEGAGGTLRVRNSSSLSRRLFLGTCSKKVCRRHTGINNVKVSATYTLKTGGILSFEKNL